MIKKRFGDRLKKLRKEKNLSQEKFSFLCGLDRTYISSVENGNRNVSIENIEKIVNALEMTISDFFNFD